MAEDAWNGRDPARVARAYTPDSRWRNRAELFSGNRIAVRFAYEWQDDAGRWFRFYGNENWEYDEAGLTQVRIASINDLPIAESERKFHWPLGVRPAVLPGLSDPGL